MDQNPRSCAYPEHRPTLPAFLACYVALLALTQLPLYLIEYIDVVDWPNHLARMHVIGHWTSSGFLQEYYVLRDPTVAPNLALELLVPALSGLFGIELAYKLFASLTVILFSSGAIALSRAYTGRLQYLSLGVVLFAYNAMFYFGLFNYLFGLGIAFWLLALWIHTGDWAAGRKLALFSLGVALLYLCHLSALGVYGLGVIAAQISTREGSGRLWPVLDRPGLTLLQFVPAAVIHLAAYEPAGTHIPTAFGASELWGTVLGKALFFLLAPGVAVSGYKFGLIAGPVLAGLVYLAWRKGGLTLVPQAAKAAGLLAVAVLLLPRTGYGSAILDGRLLPALVVIAWCGLRAKGPLTRPAMLLVVTAGVACITILTANEWHERDGHYRGVREALRTVPEGAKIATVVLHREGAETVAPITAHVAAWAVVDRSAFISNLFAWPYVPVWLGYRDHYARLAARARNTDPGMPAPAYADIRDAYDYVVVIGNDPGAIASYAATDAAELYAVTWLRLLKTRP